MLLRPFTYAGKDLLLIRQSGYLPIDGVDEVAQLQYYRALLDQFDGLVDGLVVDQTHNPGGSVSYCTGFSRLFTREPGGDFVQAMNTDREWINEYRAYARVLDPTLLSEASRKLELRAAIVEAAYDAGAGTSPPIPLLSDEVLLPDAEYVWTKPVLVLIDELAGSGGDAFPMLVQRNASIPLFGRRTMGLGGSVGLVGPLANSLAYVTLTRGLFTTYRRDESYPPEVFIENVGVHPDVEHVISVDDFRAGFVDYVTHFSEEIVRIIESAEATPPGDEK